MYCIEADSLQYQTTSNKEPWETFSENCQTRNIEVWFLRCNFNRITQSYFYRTLQFWHRFQIGIIVFQNISLQAKLISACESWMQIFCPAKFSMTNLTAAQEAEYREAFLIFDRNGDGKITNEVIFSRSMGNSNMPKLIHYEKTMDFKTI